MKKEERRGEFLGINYLGQFSGVFQEFGAKTGGRAPPPLDPRLGSVKQEALTQYLFNAGPGPSSMTLAQWACVIDDGPTIN